MALSRLIAAFVMLALFGQAVGQVEKHYVVLSATESQVAAKSFPRWPHEKVNGTWMLSRSAVDGLESNIPHIADIPFPNRAYKGSQIPHPEKYFRQYAGIVLGGHKIIYVNALCETAGNKYETYWRERFVQVFDGGDCYWSVRYDPETGRFSELMVNGVA
jgi:hypothetical protein